VVEEEIQRFARWLAQLDVMPTIASLREHGAEIVDQVLAENEGRWETLSPRDLARVEAVARAVMQRLLHEPTIRLKESGHGRQQLLRELFGLDEGPAEAPPAEAAPEAPAADNVRPLKRRA
jgi:glutamyl-tRNA reductase